jgi:hypothetical protein
VGLVNIIWTGLVRCRTIMTVWWRFGHPYCLALLLLAGTLYSLVNGDSVIILNTDQNETLCEPEPLQTSSEVMVSHHSAGTDTETTTAFNISVVTWNLNERKPSFKDVEFLTRLGTTSDAIVIGIQECENIKYRSTEGSRSRAWKALQEKALGSDFELLCRNQLGGMQIALFAKPHFSEAVVGLQSFGIPCGIGNMVANKGATCIVVKFANRSLAFINCHLAAHDKKV